jgi:hypothetical protein
MSGTGVGQTATEGLRERKQWLMRQQLSDTAARMFMERGFDAVRVARVAELTDLTSALTAQEDPTPRARRESPVLGGVGRGWSSTVAAWAAAMSVGTV